MFGAASGCDQQPKSSQLRTLGEDESLNVLGRLPRPRDASVCPLDIVGLIGVRHSVPEILRLVPASQLRPPGGKSLNALNLVEGLRREVRLPQCGHDHKGIPSITISVGPRPKLRVTSRRCTPVRPHAAQRGLVAVDREGEEITVRGDLDDGFRRYAAEGVASDDTFDFARVPVALALDDRARKDNVFEIEDGEIVIFKFLRCVDGHGIVQGTNQITKLVDGSLGHVRILSESWLCA